MIDGFFVFVCVLLACVWPDWLALMVREILVARRFVLEDTHSETAERLHVCFCLLPVWHWKAETTDKQRRGEARWAGEHFANGRGELNYDYGIGGWAPQQQQQQQQQLTSRNQLLPCGGLRHIVRSRPPTRLYQDTLHTCTRAATPTLPLRFFFFLFFFSSCPFYPLTIHTFVAPV
ncbi:uncharacterized protein IWZ02DRAFT_83729 [Phyllosticta citriasiana]|uniref:uncharacterized protein n=1 Tax=Phyllosticta citriasiana TaxID=595635 RepID=UPI0030FDA578